MESEYPKLVRDNIPEIIGKNDGVEPAYRVLHDDEEYLNALLKKAAEEARELEHSLEENNLEEELADLLEIIDAILALKNKLIVDVRAIQKEKRGTRGGFEKRIFMEEPPKR